MNRDLPPQPDVRRTWPVKLSKGVLALAAAISLTVSIWLPATADELDEQKKKLQEQLAQQNSAVQDAHVARDNAVTAAAAARQELADAEAALKQAETDLVAAEENDAQRAKELAAAEEALDMAQARVAAARAELQAADDRANEEIMVTTQDSAGLANLALIFTDVNAANLNQRAQLAETLMDASAKQLDELESKRLQLEDAEAQAAAAQQAATEARQAAAAQLQTTKETRERAANLRSDVERLVAQRDAAETAAKQAVAQEESKQQALQAESSAVERRIQERIAAEKAAAEKAAAEKAAAEKAAASKSDSQRSSSNSRSSGGSGNSGSGKSVPFQLPAGTYLTSPYGMRMHPILGYRRMHDGTDFGAGCGTPLLAPADGVVAERYYNSGYGHRLMIDHGLVDGSYVTTGFNHATHYIVSVGQKVKRGQTVGYVGTTGSSTGCHLHLMVWQNGGLVNPMSKWFRL